MKEPFLDKPRSPAGQLEAQFHCTVVVLSWGQAYELGYSWWVAAVKLLINHRGVETKDEVFTPFDFKWPGSTALTSIP